jgi:hypothetical protein
MRAMSFESRVVQFHWSFTFKLVKACVMKVSSTEIGRKETIDLVCDSTATSILDNTHDTIGVLGEKAIEQVAKGSHASEKPNKIWILFEGRVDRFHEVGVRILFLFLFVIVKKEVK